MIKNRIFSCFYVFLLLLYISCNNTSDTLFTKLESSYTNINFANNIEEDEQYNIYSFMNIYTGGGVGIGDFNNDGLSDVFFGGNMISSKLYLNKGNFIFEDITELSGLSTDVWITGVSVVDINQDGWQDIYLCVSGIENTANQLWINQKNNTFKNEAKAYGLADNDQSTQSAFFDYDLDGDLDMFLIVNPVDYSLSSVNRIKKRKRDGSSNSTDKLYRNNGNNTFTDVSVESGILIEGYSLGLAISDINNDGWSDIYVSNDFLTNDILYLNNGNGTFTDVSNKVFKHTSFAGMGNDIADFNNDGLEDVFVLDMLPEDNKRQKSIIPASNYDKFQLMIDKGYTPQYTRNTLQLNNGDNSFSEIGQFSGISQTDWSWSILLADYDNDGYKDAFVTNGFMRDIGDLDYIMYQQKANNPFGNEKNKRLQKLKAIKELSSASVKNYFFKNNKDLTFTNTSEKWGISKPNLSNGAAFADLDNDGDLDLIVNNVNEKASILKNKSTEILKTNFLKIKLKGRQGNLQGIGAKITVITAGEKQFYQHNLSRGYISSVDQNIHFGLGKLRTVDSVKIVWPDKKEQVITDVLSNQVLILDYNNSQIRPNNLEKETYSKGLFAEVAKQVGINYKHKENSHIDFKLQPLLPHMHSKNGPKMSVADINGDQLEDFFIGGSVGNSGVIFFQQKDGTFIEQPLELDVDFEDMGSVLFDVDEDGDKDLYVVSGGSEFKKNSEQYRDRLYLNDGKGNFTKQNHALPSNIKSSGSVVVPVDFDADGDLDLFVGGRLVPGEYPLTPKSFLLRNDNGKFTDVTNELSKSLAEVGMVTDAIWVDYNNDNLIDLIVAGEFMPISVFENTGDGFNNVTEKVGLINTDGWWNSLAVADMDKDGDMDVIAGNLGTNSRYKAKVDEPLCIYTKDYDANNSLDPIMSYYIQGENYIAHPRDLLINQIPAMRSRFKTYNEYASVTFNKAFLSEELENNHVVKAVNFNTSYFENNEDGTFTIKTLSQNVQLGPVNSIQVIDVNNDTHMDLLMVGNNYSGEPSVGNHDAFIGGCLLGDGKGGFTPMSFKDSGFFVDTDAKDIVTVKIKSNENIVLVSSNSGFLKAFKASKN